MKFSARTWVSVITFVIIVILLYVSRHDILEAWHLVTTINPWWLAAFAPLLALSYLAVGEMVFSYLRSKGAIRHVSPMTQMRVSLEVNFVNHALPSGGASGISYMTWRLGRLGVSHGKAAMAQVVRIAVNFAAFSVLTVIAVLAITIDVGVNRWLILVSSMLVGLIVVIMVLGAYFLSSISRVRNAAHVVKRIVDTIVQKVTFGRRMQAFSEADLEKFLLDLHDDYIELMKDKRHLIKPFIWALSFVIIEVTIFWLAFLALGSPINPAPILVAYGVASIAGFLVVTPGGSGAYEALMVSFIMVAVTGLDQGVAIAAVLLARVLILIVIIILGYAFYQRAIIKYGTPPSKT